jgi:hypothetical protein
LVPSVESCMEPTAAKWFADVYIHFSCICSPLQWLLTLFRSHFNHFLPSLYSPFPA